MTIRTTCLVIGWCVVAAASRRDVGRPVTDDLTLAQAATCAVADLDGHRMRASDIPVAHTPNCGYTTVPAPVLAACTEPLATGVADLRGVWVDTSRPHGPDYPTGTYRLTRVCGPGVKRDPAQVVEMLRGTSATAPANRRRG